MSDGWSWVTESRYPSFFIVLARSKTPEELLQDYGVPPQKIGGIMRLEEAEEAFPFDQVDHLIRVGGVRDWSFSFEDRISLGMAREVRERVSRNTETLEIFKGGDGTNFFQRMKDGRRLEAFEPRNPIDVSGDGPFLISETLQQSFQPDGGGRRAITALTDAISENYGITIDREVLKGPLLTVALRN
ncbi:MULTISPECIES: DUF6461 domain-containing protein [unclassified Streptomyces]|uniref:DUF6461 domain-containing protein n=1 Tax=unclassified Streptomyces TaxID=2593676 RepID=UPI00117D0AA6|nr:MULTISPECIES: DUF6461 domain-containing protein [unclassified Streptomyces]MYT97327.1 hypothetical protein [Streptomyces sp. SID8350]